MIHPNVEATDLPLLSIFVGTTFYAGSSGFFPTNVPQNFFLFHNKYSWFTWAENTFVNLERHRLP